ncbi:hypothetical protein HN51_005408 [Arachis hypogaea]
MEPLTQGFYNANKFAKLVRRREFMASAAEGTTGALTCATCGCHRNFHRRKELAAPSRDSYMSLMYLKEQIQHQLSFNPHGFGNGMFALVLSFGLLLIALRSRKARSWRLEIVPMLGCTQFPRRASALILNTSESNRLCLWEWSFVVLFSKMELVTNHCADGVELE